MSITSNVTFPVFETLSADFIDGESHASFGPISTEIEAYTVITANADITTPENFITAHADVSLNGNYADIETPEITLEGLGGANGSLTAVGFSLAGTLTVQNIGRAELRVPIITIDTLSTTGGIGKAELELKNYSSIVAYAGANGVLSTPEIGLGATGTTTGIGSAELTVPKVSVSGLLSIGDFANAELTVPDVAMLWGVFDNNTPTFTLEARSLPDLVVSNNAYVMNTKNNGITKYEDYPFDNVLRVGSTSYGILGNLVYLIGGDLDIAAQIDANLETHPSDYKDLRIKNVPYIYIAARTQGSFQAGTVADEIYRDGAILTSHNRTGVYNYRAKFGRGVKATHWGFTIRNIDGADFQIQSIGPLTAVHGRKI